MRGRNDRTKENKNEWIRLEGKWGWNLTSKPTDLSFLIQDIFSA